MRKLSELELASPYKEWSLSEERFVFNDPLL